MDVSSHFRGKRITLMGLGLLGRGVGDAKYLAECGAELVITDLKSGEELTHSIAELKSFENIRYLLGGHRFEDFRERDFILKAAGVSLDSPYIAEARKNGIGVRMSADIFVEFAGIPIIGVTGTRGKSTVTHMLGAILAMAGKKALLGGNIRGVSTLALLPEVVPEHVAVLELDSWQCQGLGEIKKSPHIGVFTTFFPDHLNYYKNDLGAYLDDKANIFLYQNSEDTLVLGSQCALQLVEKYGKSIKARIIAVDESELPNDWVLQIPGTHNRYNAALALAAARAYGVEDTISRSALEAFSGVPGRLQFLRETKDIRIYNDNNSTTPEATLAALRAVDERQNIVLIMGGADKGLDMNRLLAEIPAHTKRVILLAGTGTNKILEWLPGASVYDSLEGAVAEALRAATQGDIILFSPAFASFGMFKNEYDRGDQFDAVVVTL